MKHISWERSTINRSVYFGHERGTGRMWKLMRINNERLEGLFKQYKRGGL